MVRAMNDWFGIFISWIMNTLCDAYNVIFAIIVSALGYFSPIKNAIHLVLFFFLLDVFFGVWAAKKVRKERLRPRLIWEKTIPRSFMSIVIIIATYLWDTTFGQDWVQTYMLVGWFISGVLILSITKNAADITHWSGFLAIGNIIRREVKDKTGEDAQKHS